MLRDTFFVAAGVKVDAHNVVPVWTASDHLETMARTIRPKIHARPDLFTAFPVLSANPEGTKLPSATDWIEAEESLDLDESVKGEGRGSASLTRREAGRRGLSLVFVIWRVVR